MRVALDTNILAYAEGTNGVAMESAALDLVQRLPPEETLLPLQTLGELFAVLVRKAGRSRASARTSILRWSDALPVIDTSDVVLISAADLAAGHQLFIWDAVVLAAAADARCRLLLSEDFQDGFTWGGVTVVNPFAREKHVLLESVLGPPRRKPGPSRKQRA